MRNPEMQPFEAMLSSDTAAEDSQERARQSFEKQASFLRMRFLDLFHKNMTVELDNPNWMLYEVPLRESELPAGANATRELVLMAYKTGTNPDFTFRIFSNDFYVAPTKRSQFMSEDFILDFANDAQYCIRVTGTRKRELRRQHVPIFQLKDDRTIQFATIPSFAEIGYVQSGADGLPAIFPFGDMRDINDKIASLHMAHDLLSEVARLVPRATGHQ